MLRDRVPTGAWRLPLAAAAAVALAAVVWLGWLGLGKGDAPGTFRIPLPDGGHYLASVRAFSAPPLLRDEPDRSRLWGDAEAAYESGRFESAARILGDILAQEPASFAARFYRGISLLAFGQALDARKEFGQARRQAESDGLSTESLAWFEGLAALRERDLTAARRAFEEAGREEGPHARDATDLLATLSGSRGDSSPASLQPLQRIRTVDLDSTQSPRRITLLQQRSLSFILDTSTGRVHVLDAEYDHTDEPSCVPLTLYGGTMPAGHEAEVCDAPGGAATDDGMSVRRGVLAVPGHTVVAVAVRDGIEDATEVPILFLVTTKAQVLVVDADSTGTDLADYLWVDMSAAASLQDSSGSMLSFGVDTFAVFDRGASPPVLWIASSSKLRSYAFTGSGFTGAPGVTHSLRGTARGLALRGGTPWALTSYGLESPGASFPLADAADFVLGHDHAYVTRLADRDLFDVDLTSLTQRARLILKATGPIALDDAAGRLYVAVSGRLLVLDTTRALTQVTALAQPGVVALAATRSHEILALIDRDPSQAVAAHVATVFFDETALASGQQAPPLALTNQTSIEHPRDGDDRTCPGGGGGGYMAGLKATLTNNGPLLNDLPGEFAIAMIPESAVALAGCPDIRAAFDGIWVGPNRHLAPLFHHATLCTDVDDVRAPTPAEALATDAASLSGEIAALEGVTKPIEFIAGINTHSDQGVACDRLGALASIGAPAKYPVFGAITDSPVFNLGGCGNLSLRECHSGFDRSLDVERADIEVLNLLVRRALAVRQSDRRDSHWSFHLPDVATYDYTRLMDGTRNCVRTTDGTWGTVPGGPECEAALLQEFLRGVDARFVRRGMARWASPASF